MITGHTGGHQQLMDIYHLGEDRIEQSSDFCSHSPANSSVDTNPSWGSVEEITTTDASVSHNGDIRRNVVGLRGRNGVGSISQSSPPFRVSPHNYHHNHLTDSGIGFDDSTRNGNGQFSRGFVKNSSHRHSVHGSVVPLSTPEAVDENTNFIAVGGDAIPANVAQQQQLLQGSISGTLGSFPVSTNKREKRGRPTGLRTTSECTCWQVCLYLMFLADLLMLILLFLVVAISPSQLRWYQECKYATQMNQNLYRL